MSKIIKVYCEGKSGSYDYDILEKVIKDLPVLIDPLGSVRGAGAIIQFKESSNAEKSDFKVFFRDRDFDKAIPDFPTLEQDEEIKYCYFSYHNTIENYLFNVTLFYKFVQAKQIAKKYQINNENEAKQKLVDAANKIRAYQAVRHTMGKMRTDKTNFGTKLTDESGILPDNLEIEYCREKALEKIKYSKSQTDDWTEAGFDETLQAFLAKFDDDFMNRLDFLVWFQGKDFASSLKTILPEFPLKSYYKYAKEYFDYTLYPDLVQLRKLIEDNL
jgi:hypothetical protein